MSRDFFQNKKRSQHSDLHVLTVCTQFQFLMRLLFCCHQSSVPTTANSSQPVSCQLSLELAQRTASYNNLTNVICCTKKGRMALNTVSFITRLIVWVTWTAVRNIWTQNINPIACKYRHLYSKVASKPTSTRTAVHQNIYSLQIMSSITSVPTQETIFLPIQRKKRG